MSRKYDESIRACRCRDCSNYRRNECIAYDFPVAYPDNWRMCEEFSPSVDNNRSDMVKSRRPKGK